MGNARPIVALAMAASCVLGLIGVRLLAFGVADGRERDAAVLNGFATLWRGSVDPALKLMAQLAGPVPYACIGLACVATALARGRMARAVAVACALVATGVTTQLLKHLLAYPRHDYFLLGGQLDPASWPSGHATAAMTLALCAIVVAPPRWRAATAVVGLCLSVGLSYATLALTWHYPSDILGGFFVAGLGVSVALAVLPRFETAEPEPTGASTVGWLLALGTAGALVAAAVVGRASHTGDEATVVTGALAIAALAVMLGCATVAAAPLWGHGAVDERDDVLRRGARAEHLGDAELL
jgi:membrane-associated phospholipid phosphatase